MFNHDHYVPILKWKRGERTALGLLNPIVKNSMTPLIEIQPVPYDHSEGNFSKTIDDHINDIGNQVNLSWGIQRPILVDVNTLYDNEDFEDDILQSGQHPVEFVIEDIENYGIPAIPVTGIYRHQSFHAAVKSLCKKYNRGVCIRLEESDLSDLSALRSDIDHLLNFLQVDKGKIDIILDYKQIIPQ